MSHHKHFDIEQMINELDSGDKLTIPMIKTQSKSVLIVLIMLMLLSQMILRSP